MKKVIKWALFAPVFASALIIGFTACSDSSDDPEPVPVPEPDVERSYYHILGKVQGDEKAANYIAAVSDLSSGSLSFLGNGMEAMSDGTRGTLIFSSAHDEYLYAVDYHGGGKVDQYIVQEDGKYAKGETFYYELALGSSTARGTILDKETFAVYITTSEAVVGDDGETVEKYNSIVTIAILDLPGMTLRATIKDTLEFSPETYAESPISSCFRIETPCLAGDKLYFGMNVRTSGERTAIPSNGVETLVFDYPSLDNGQVIRSGLDISGTTNCDSSSGMEEDENGDVYQFTRYDDSYPTWDATGPQAYFLRMKNGIYDNTYSFDITAALGLNVIGMHWQYAKDGIGYAVIKDLDKVATEESNIYTLVRVDLYNKTAVKLNTPYGNQAKMRGGVIEGDYYYYAITPDAGEPAVYKIDITSTSPDAFEKGLEFDKGISMVVQGVL